MEQGPDLTRIMPWPLQRITTSFLLQQLQRHIKMIERKRKYNKIGTNLPTDPPKRQDKDNDKDMTRQDIFTNTIKKMKTKTTHAQRGLPHTSLHPFSLKHRSRTPPPTQLSHTSKHKK